MKENILKNTSIDSIDELATIQAGKRVCEQYAPLVQQRRKEQMRDPLRSASLIKVSNDTKSGNSQEREILRRCEWENDQIAKFCDAITEIETERDARAGQYLKFRYILDMSDEEICEQLGIAERTLRRRKSLAYYLIACWAHVEVYNDWKKEYLIEFIDEDLFDDR